MFCWEPEGRYHCAKLMAIATFWFSTEHCWTSENALLALHRWSMHYGYQDVHMNHECITHSEVSTVTTIYWADCATAQDFVMGSIELMKIVPLANQKYNIEHICIHPSKNITFQGATWVFITTCHSGKLSTKSNEKHLPDWHFYLPSK